MDIFISHSSKDKEFVHDLVGLLRMGLRLGSERIRCTSLDETQLDPGVEIDENLRKEINESKVFIVVLSPYSIQSAYVLFELGARWGAGKRMIPLMMKNLSLKDFSSPLLNRHIVRCDRAGLLKVIKNVGETLQIELEPEETLEDEIERLTSYVPEYYSKLAYAVLSYVVDKDFNFALLKDRFYRKIQPPGRRLEPLDKPHEVAVSSVSDELNLPANELVIFPKFKSDLFKETKTVPPPFQVQEEQHPHKKAILHYDFVYVFTIDRVKPNIRTIESSERKFDPKWYSLNEVKERKDLDEYGPHEDMIPTMERINDEIMKYM